jgi:predicted DNA binding protein
MKDNTATSLSHREREALRTAFDQGYFDVPRHVPLNDLADRLDTTDVELSKLLRRGTATLLRQHYDELSSQ